MKVLNWFMLTYFWLRYSKTGTKKVQLVFQHCSKRSWKTMLRFLPPTFKPHSLATNQIVAGCQKFFCRKYRVVLLFASVYVARLPCFAASYVILSYPIRSQYLLNLQQPLFVSIQVWTWMVKRATCLSTRSAAMLRNKLHVFVASFTLALSITIFSHFNNF